MHNHEQRYAGNYAYGNYSNPSQPYNQYAAEQHRREYRKKEQKKKKRSRRNGVIAATAGAA